MCVLESWRRHVTHSPHRLQWRLIEERWLSIYHFHHHDSHRPHVHLPTSISIQCITNWSIHSYHSSHLNSLHVNYMCCKSTQFAMSATNENKVGHAAIITPCNQRKIAPTGDWGYLLTLTLTSDDLESHIVLNVSLTLTNTTIWFVAGCIVFHCGRTDISTYVCTDGQTLLLGLLSHLSRDDLKNRHTHHY